MVVVEWGCRCLWSQLVTWDNYSHCTSGRWWWWGWGSLFHGQSSWGSSSDPPLEYQQEWSPQRQGELWSSGKMSIHVFSIIRIVLVLNFLNAIYSYISAEDGTSDLCTYHTLCCDHKWMQSGSSSWSEWSKQTCFIWLTKPIQTKISVCFDPIDLTSGVSTGATEDRLPCTCIPNVPHQECTSHQRWWRSVQLGSIKI